MERLPNFCLNVRGHVRANVVQITRPEGLTVVAIVIVTAPIHYGLRLSNMVHKMSDCILNVAIVSADYSLFMRLHGEA